MRDKRIILFISALLALHCISIARPTCAVATFEARGVVTGDEASTLSDWLESEFVRSDSFSMVARSKMAEIIKEQQMPAACGSTGCAVELGKLLSSQYIVFGSASKVGTTYVLIASVVDVETAALKRTARYQSKGSIDKLLETGVPSIADQLLGTNVVRAATKTAPKSISSKASAPKENSWFQKNWPWVAGGAAVVVGGAALAAGGGGGSSDSEEGTLSGTWNGTSGTGQAPSQLTLTQNGTSISGQLIWPGGDRRSVNGWVSGNSVTLNIGGGDTWEMTWSGDTLQGIGNKYGGGTYALNFYR